MHHQFATATPAAPAHFDFDRELVILHRTEAKKIKSMLCAVRKIPEWELDDRYGDMLVKAFERKDTYQPERSSLKTWFLNQISLEVGGRAKRSSAFKQRLNEVSLSAFGDNSTDGDSEKESLAASIQDPLANLIEDPLTQYRLIALLEDFASRLTSLESSVFAQIGVEDLFERLSCAQKDLIATEVGISALAVTSHIDNLRKKMNDVWLHHFDTHVTGQMRTSAEIAATAPRKERRGANLQRCKAEQLKTAQ